MDETKRIIRPLSPHLQIYRPQMSSVTSIFVRITGNGLIVSTMLIVWWLFAMTRGGAQYEMANAVLHSWPGTIVLILSLWAVWFHYLGGIRHLIFDAGRGLDVASADRMGWIMILGSVALTALTVYLI
jgi:succinate dehydrogenase / fumarate reductase cytochrome b subunit